MNNFLETSLDSIASISIHWSSDCNMACKYCYIDKDKKAMASYNKEIRESLENGAFINNIKRIFASHRNQIEHISLWGAEPTINGKYFKDFIYPLLDFFPNVITFMFSTNALVGGPIIYTQFVEPLYQYAESKKRKIFFELQFSLDGPTYINDSSRHEGAAKSTINSCQYIVDKLPLDLKYFSLRVFSKATLDVSYMKEMNNRGIEAFDEYYQFFDNTQKIVQQAAKDNPNIVVQMNAEPTLVDPGYHTIEDGQTLAKWVSHLKNVDRSKLSSYKGKPLFTQSISGVFIFFDAYDNPIAQEFNAYSCSASKNNITIDYKGILYTCNRLCRNSALSDEMKHKHAMRSGSNLGVSDKQWLKRTWGFQAFHNDIMSRKYIFDQMAITMALAGQIDKKYAEDADARLLLFYSFIGVMCHIGAEEDYTQNPSLMPASYYRYLGNGAVDEMINYMNIEMKRKEIKPWNIAM